MGTNPVVKRIALRAYPEWEVRRYADGMFDVHQVDGVAVSPGFDSFGECVAHVKRQTAVEPLEVETIDVYCEWFALCDHLATCVKSHPILGDVPICDRCLDKINSL